MERIQVVASHLTASSGHSFANAASSKKSPDDVVIVCAVRTPICRAGRGGLKDCKPEELLAATFKGILERTKIKPDIVEDIIVGNVLQTGSGATAARMAALYAGFPDTTAVASINRQCSSGLQAVASIASAIRAGYIDVGVGAGMESMSRDYGPSALLSDPSDDMLKFKPAADCLIPMGITSENVASRFSVDRRKQDEFAVSSHRKAAEAREKGLFKEEIVPVKVKDANGAINVVSADDGIRPDSNLQGLAKLRSSFGENGSTTAGNASQISDGAAAVLLMSRRKAQSLGVPILGRFIAFSAVGVPPDIMGIGPAVAIPSVLKKCGLSIKDVGIFEINEAFASQAVYCVEKLQIDQAKVNPKGGAIALGHPLGCTGARQIATLLPELKRQKQRFGVVSMCIGTGMGAAAVIENEQQ